MPTTSPFSYNSGTTISGTSQVGNLAVGTTPQDYSSNPGGVKWWMGPNQDLGFVITIPYSANTHPTPVPGVFASLGFYRSNGFDDNSFINLSEFVSRKFGNPQTFANGFDASAWLTANGYWNSYSSNTNPNQFISTWRLTSSPQSITLPYLETGNYSGTIDWGDGQISTNSYSARTHNYTNAGDYIITIEGVTEGWSFESNFGLNANLLIEINQWGHLNIGNVQGQFSNCSNLVLTGVTDVINLSGVTNLNNMFQSCSSLTDINRVDEWDVSSVTAMTYMFASSAFNGDISTWDVSNVTTIQGLFSSTPFNQNIGSWNVSNVTSLSAVFYAATSFNQNINSWDVSKVTTLDFLFYGATSFNQPLSGWNVSSVTDLYNTFNGASAFNQPIGNWNVSGVTSLNGTFGGTIYNQPLSGWNVSNVTDMGGIFAGSSFNQPIGNWDVSNVTTMGYAFAFCSFNQDISTWDVSSVTDMSYMFWFNGVFNQDLSNWCVTLIPTVPPSFADDTPSWVLPKPVWGTCPVV